MTIAPPKKPQHEVPRLDVSGSENVEERKLYAEQSATSIVKSPESRKKESPVKRAETDRAASGKSRLEEEKAAVLRSDTLNKNQKRKQKKREKEREEKVKLSARTGAQAAAEEESLVVSLTEKEIEDGWEIKDFKESHKRKVD